jgi:Zn-dependent protease with chaperone function
MAPGTSRRANAALVGVGSTRRILLSDTLLADFSDDEIEVILAHEIGHHVHADLSMALIVEFVRVTAAFAVGAAVIGTAWKRFGLGGPADVAGLRCRCRRASGVLRDGTAFLALSGEMSVGPTSSH